MSKILRTRILEQDNFKSGQPGPLSYLIHKMSDKGNYIVTVDNGNTPVMRFTITCDPSETAPNSVNIDLARPLAAQNLQEPIKVNNEHGYLLFYHSQMFVDWKIEIRSQSTNRLEFTSIKPNPGDMMAFNLIKPGRYSLQSPAKPAADIDVLHPEEISAQRNLRTTGGVPSNRFTHKDLNIKQQKIIQPGQGIVFEFSEEMPSFTLNLKEAKTAKVPFDERLKAELANKIKVLKKDPALVNELRKRYEWNVGKGRPGL